MRPNLIIINHICTEVPGNIELLPDPKRDLIFTEIAVFFIILIQNHLKLHLKLFHLSLVLNFLERFEIYRFVIHLKVLCFLCLLFVFFMEFAIKQFSGHLHVELRKSSLFTCADILLVLLIFELNLILMLFLLLFFVCV